MPNRTGYQAYQKNKYETASPHRLILMLYDGVLSNLHHGLNALDNGDHTVAHDCTIKAQNIVSELLSCLNVEQGGDIAKNLQQLYLYAINQLVKANVHKDKSLLEEIEAYFRDLRSAWMEIGKEVGLGGQQRAD